MTSDVRLVLTGSDQTAQLCATASEAMASAPHGNGRCDQYRDLPANKRSHSDDIPGVTGIDLLPEELRDEVVQHLLSVLRLAVRTPGSAFVGQVASALKTYLQVHRGRSRDPQHSMRGSLPVWKERRLKDLLRSQLSCKVSLERLATQSGLSIRHLTRAFKQSTGFTPHRYLLGLRLEKARELLLSPTLRLQDIAMTCGFNDQSHFTRAFSAAEKLSPGAWRRLHLMSAAPTT
jgi:AraC-like DNA-binding protein